MKKHNYKTWGTGSVPLIRSRLRFPFLASIPVQQKYFSCAADDVTLVWQNTNTET